MTITHTWLNWGTPDGALQSCEALSHAKPERQGPQALPPLEEDELDELLELLVEVEVEPVAVLEPIELPVVVEVLAVVEVVAAEALLETEVVAPPVELEWVPPLLVAALELDDAEVGA